MAGLCIPLSTLRPWCYHHRRMTRGQDGSLFLSRAALSSATPCRFIPALSPIPFSSPFPHFPWRHPGAGPRWHLTPSAPPPSGRPVFDGDSGNCRQVRILGHNHAIGQGASDSPNLYVDLLHATPRAPQFDEDSAVLFGGLITVGPDGEPRKRMARLRRFRSRLALPSMPAQSSPRTGTQMPMRCPMWRSRSTRARTSWRSS